MKHNKNYYPIIPIITIIYTAFCLGALVYLQYNRHNAFKIFSNDEMVKSQKEIVKLNIKKETRTIDNAKIEYPYFNNKELNTKVNLIIQQLQDQKEIIMDYNVKIIDNRYVNMFFTTKNNDDNKEYHHNYLYNISDAKKVEVSNLIKTSKIKDFNNVIHEMLLTKYPSFIGLFITTNIDTGNISYDIYDNKMILYFDKYNIVPVVKDNISIELNYQEIKEYLNFTDIIIDKNYVNSNITTLSNDKPTLIFTFDDGPSAETTPKMLDILKKNHVHATFFELGYKMESYPGLVKRVLEEGNEVGNHSYSHPNLFKVSDENVLYQINHTNEIFNSITGENISLIRVPYGNSNARIKSLLNYPLIAWNADPRDWESRNKDAVYNAVLNDAKDGSMYVMHDIHPSTVEAIEMLLPELYARGFQVASVSEYLNLKGINLEPHNTYHSLQ